MSDFISRIAPAAIEIGMAGNVLPSLIIAQGILESGSGTSELALAANNLFGIKKGTGWTGETYAKNSAEWSEEKGWYSVVSDFRKYESFEGAIQDLVSKYNTMSRYSEVLGKTDPIEAAHAVFNAGYATDPTYPTKLINIIDTYALRQYDIIKEDIPMVTIKKQLAPQSVINAVTSGHKNARKYITIHETANTAKGAGAQSHANLQSNGNSRAASWHYQVDDKIAIQSFEHTVSTWQAGDGGGNGNMNSISIEICVNSDSHYPTAVKNAWELVRHIRAIENIPMSNVKQHNFWSGKNCPTYLRAGNRGVTWTTFLNQAAKSIPEVKPVSNPVINYRVRKTWLDAKSQIGAFTGIEGAIEMADKTPGYKVFDKTGKLVYPIPVIKPVEPDIVYPAYPMGEADRIGEIVMNRDWPYRALPDNNSEIFATLVAGHKAHLYEIRGDFYRLGRGWVYKGAADITVDYADRDAKAKAEAEEAARIKAAEEKAKAEAEQAAKDMEQAIKDAAHTARLESLSMLRYAIVINSAADYEAGRLIHLATGFPMFERNGLFNRKIADEIIAVGGTHAELADNNANTVTMVAGKTREETLEAAKQYVLNL